MIRLTSFKIAHNVHPIARGSLMLGFFMLIGSCGKLPTPEPHSSPLHFVGDFESGSLSGFHFLVFDTAQNTQLVTYPVRKGNHALKNTLRPHDYVKNGYRTELAVFGCAQYQNDMYYAFSFYIDSNYTDANYNLICQWQDLPNYEQGETWEPSPILRGSSPPLALVYVNGHLEIKMNDNPQSNDHTFQVGDSYPIQQGAWYDVVAHVYWDDTNDAFTSITINGLPITPFNGTDNKYYHRNLFNRAGNYFKFGQYRGKHDTEKVHTVYFDEVKIGTSYQEVALQ